MIHPVPNRFAKSAGRRIGLTLLMIVLVGGIAAGAVNGTAGTPQFNVAATPDSQKVYPGDSVSYTIKLERTSKFTGAVGLAVSGLPGGVTANLNPPTIPTTGSSSTLTLNVAGTTVPGSYDITVTGSGGGTTRSASAKLVALESAFTLSGNLSAPLALGPPGQKLNLSISNPFHQALTVSNIKLVVASTSKPACPTNQFGITQLPASYSVTVPAGATKSLSQLGATSTPVVTWINEPYAQNGCLGAHLTFSYTASGTR